MTSARPLPDTPCVGICSTGIGDSVCRGCRRYAHEIIDWNRYTPAQRQQIWQRLEAIVVQIMPRYFELNDPALLASALKSHGIPYRCHFSPWYWIYDLLRAAGARPTLLLADFGLAIVTAQAHRTLADIKDSVLADTHDLASAWYALQFRRIQPEPAAPSR